MAATRVLVVDDDPTIRKMLVEYLTEHGYEVAQAAGGEAMRVELARGAFAAVLLDIGLESEANRARMRSRQLHMRFGMY